MLTISAWILPFWHSFNAVGLVDLRSDFSDQRIIVWLPFRILIVDFFNFSCLVHAPPHGGTWFPDLQ